LIELPVGDEDVRVVQSLRAEAGKCAHDATGYLNDSLMMMREPTPERDVLGLAKSVDRNGCDPHREGPFAYVRCMEAEHLLHTEPSGYGELGECTPPQARRGRYERVKFGS
jgi:hypothetical protein